MNKPTDLILPHGGYRKLRSFVVSLAAYDGTVIFCSRFIDKRSRTNDQMVQAARSGVQNIAEGSLASGTSKKTELKLTSVARASLGELIRDYEDYLRQNDLPIWEKNSPRVLAMRGRLAGKIKSKKPSDRSDKSGLSEGLENSEFFDEPLLSALHALKTTTAEVSANILLCLTHQATYLLARQMERLEKDFVEKGGFTERLYSYRKEHRGAGKVKEEETEYFKPSDESDLSDLSDF